MKKTLMLVLAGSVFAVAACDGTPATDDADGGAGGEAPGTGGTAAGGTTTGGAGTGGATGGGAMGGLGGLGGMGGALSIEEVCNAWCATTAGLGCADDPDEPTCRTNCEAFVTPGCEAEFLTWRSCEAPLTFVCQDVGGMVTAVKADSNQCVEESNAELECFLAANPQ